NFAIDHKKFANFSNPRKEFDQNLFIELQKYNIDILDKGLELYNKLVVPSRDYFYKYIGHCKCPIYCF
ncbi:MAG: hypothetical protein EBS07_12605, partial [Sphingobacteriia bacterium]|nr:hypothetical protein [Sphingobacteriia bacterium]